MERCLGCMNEFDDALNVCPHCGYVKGTAEKSKNHLKPGTMLIDRYLIGRCLGQGGFGITYIAWDQRLYKKVAIKEFMPTSLASRITGQADITCYNDEAHARFQNGIRKMLDESRRLARFNDLESVVKVYDCFEANQTAYIIMELLDGETIKSILAQQKAIDLERTAEIMLPVLQGLREIHASGLIHRDISPDNLFVCKNGKVKLLDFGSARFATGSDEKSLSVILKPGYAPKEQYSATAPQGPYTDVYAVCATIYKMLTGVTPIDSLERRVQHDRLAPIETKVAVPKYFAQVLAQGLAIEAEDRLQTVDPLVEALESIVAAKASAGESRKMPKVQKLPKAPKPPKKKKQNKRLVKVLIPCAAVLLAGIAAFCIVAKGQGWWPFKEEIIQIEEYTGDQQAILDQALAADVPTDLLPAAQERQAWEQRYLSSLSYTADAGEVYADYTDADGRLVLHERIAMPQNEADDFTMYTYTDTGDADTVVRYTSDGSVASAQICYYDGDSGWFVSSVYEDGQFLSATEYAVSGDGDAPKALLIHKADGTLESTAYSDKGKETIEKHFDASGKKIYERIEFTDPRRTKIREFDDEDDVKKEIVIDWNADDRQTEYVETGYGDQQVAKYTWEYDAKGRVTSHTVFDENNAQQSRIAFAYGKGGLRYITKEKNVAQNGAIREYQYDLTDGSYISYDEYDGRGNLLSAAKYDANGVLQKKTVKAYDEEDRVSSMEQYDEKEELTERRAEYCYGTEYYSGEGAYEGEYSGYTVFDADGKRLYSIVEADAGSDVFEEKTEYDDQERATHLTVREQGVLVKDLVTTYADNDRSRQTYRLYDENGDLTEKRVEALNGSGGYEFIEEYDANEVLRLKRVSSGNEWKELTIYDAGGNLTDRYALETRVVIGGQIVKHYNGNGVQVGQIAVDDMDWWMEY